MDAEALAEEIDRRIRALPEHGVEPVRRVRREYSERLRTVPAGEVVALALALVGRQRWVGYELVYRVEAATPRAARLTPPDIG